jgi:hypothetical protein
MIDKKYIKENLDQYLEFDSDKLFFNSNYLVRVFGGAIRDIIAKKEIHDVDILVSSQSFPIVKQIIEEQGYFYHSQLSKKDIQSIYSDIQVISEPHTFIKNNKIIQLIRPRLSTNRSIGPNHIKKDNEREYIKNFFNLIQNVDFSCCAVSYDGKTIYQNYPNSIIHCQNNVFIENKFALMYSEKRAIHRKYKLIDRGWKEISNSKSIERDEKLQNILNNNEEVIFTDQCY